MAQTGDPIFAEVIAADTQALLDDWMREQTTAAASSRSCWSSPPRW